MRPLSRLVLAGAAFLALGTGTLAIAAARNSHVLTVRLPDGTLEKIHYTGETAPTVRFQALGQPVVMFAPLGAAPFRAVFAPDPMFARMEQISAAMDRQAAEMMAAFDAAGPGIGFAPLTQVDLARMPAGAQGYTMVSTLSGADVCTRTTEYLSRPGQAPKVTTHVSAGCKDAAAAGAAPTVAAPEAAPPVQRAPGLIQASYRAR
jgi:hypothetical protein